jgi:hypothetical protein
VGEGVVKAKGAKEAKEAKEVREEVAADPEARVVMAVTAGPAVVVVARARRTKRDSPKAVNSLQAIVLVDPTQPLQLQRRSAWQPHSSCNQSEWLLQNRCVRGTECKIAVQSVRYELSTVQESSLQFSLVACNRKNRISATSSWHCYIFLQIDLRLKILKFLARYGIRNLERGRQLALVFRCGVVNSADEISSHNG